MSNFLNMLKKKYGEDLHDGTQQNKCWDTGIYNLNKALGGGIPSGRISLLVGKESAGKAPFVPS